MLELALHTNGIASWACARVLDVYSPVRFSTHTHTHCNSTENGIDRKNLSIHYYTPNQSDPATITNNIIANTEVGRVDSYRSIRFFSLKAISRLTVPHIASASSYPLMGPVDPPAAIPARPNCESVATAEASPRLIPQDSRVSRRPALHNFLSRSVIYISSRARA